MNNLLKAKNYSVCYPKTLYGKKRYFLLYKLRIECIGGESMKEENELVFLNPEDVPRLIRGGQGRDWEALFDKIPKGRVLEMKTGKDNYGSAPNIRSQVKFYNKDAKKEVLTSTQRTASETDEVTVYVQRVA